VPDDDGAGDVKLLKAVDGVPVAYRRWEPDGNVGGVVQIVHGAAEHSGRYSRPATQLTGRGLAVYAMDLRGHGRTAESTGIGRFGGLGIDTALDDVRAQHLIVEGEHPAFPRVHEAFNETNRDEVTGGLLAWLDQRITTR
jgi:alpha-beta hydrolase superfamily lysophospholipase